MRWPKHLFIGWSDRCCYCAAARLAVYEDGSLSCRPARVARLRRWIGPLSIGLEVVLEEGGYFLQPPETAPGVWLRAPIISLRVARWRLIYDRILRRFSREMGRRHSGWRVSRA